MREFRDTQNGVWRVEVTVGLRRRVLQETGVDLCGIILDQATHEKLAADHLKFVDVLISVFDGQFQAKGLTVEQWLDRLAGEQLQAAWRALEEAVVDFFRPEDRETARKALAVRRQVDRQLHDTVHTTIQQALTTLEQGTLTAGSSAASPSSPSTPIPGVSPHSTAWPASGGGSTGSPSPI